MMSALIPTLVPAHNLSAAIFNYVTAVYGILNLLFPWSLEKKHSVWQRTVYLRTSLTLVPLVFFETRACFSLRDDSRHFRTRRCRTHPFRTSIVPYAHVRQPWGHIRERTSILFPQRHVADCLPQNKYALFPLHQPFVLPGHFSISRSEPPPEIGLYSMSCPPRSVPTPGPPPTPLRSSSSPLTTTPLFISTNPSMVTVALRFSFTQYLPRLTRRQSDLLHRCDQLAHFRSSRPRCEWQIGVAA